MISRQIFAFLWSGSSLFQKFQRQTTHVTHAQLPTQPTKLQIRHVFELGSEDPVHKYSSAIKLRVWDNPKFNYGAESSEPMDGDVDFALLNQIIDTDGKFALEAPSSDPLKSRQTILNLARMASHAYKRIPSSPWKDMDPGWHVNSTFGWEGTSVKGYVFSDEKDENLVIAFKGTTFSIIPGGGDTTGHSDKKSDNLMFSCCCGATNGNWNQVCSCGRENNVCSEKCLVSHARDNTTYYHGAKLIYDYVQDQYKAANITLVGHSLGGALASLVAWETGRPAFTFEAPGERLYAERLGLDLSEKTRKARIFHIGHNADPIFMGTCNGKLSLCYIGGYGMDSKCHTAVKCLFDAVGGLGWSQSLIHHRSRASATVVEKWADNSAKIDVKCSRTPECKDCSDWSFVDRA